MLTDGTKKIMEAIGEYKGQVAFGVDYDFIPGDFPAPPSEKLFVKHKKPILIGQDEVKGDQPKRFYLAISVKNKKTGKIERGILSQRNYLRNLWQGQGVLGNDLYQPIDKSPSEEEKIVRAKNWNPNYVVDEIKEEYKQSPLQEFYSLNEYLRYVACGKKFAYDDSVIERITSIVNGTHELYELALPELDGPLEIG